MDDLVFVQHGQAVTNSRIVANVFEKEHKNVIKAIYNLQCDLTVEGISRLTYKPRHYTDARGKVCPMFEMNRDGFTLLAMGFNGRKALKFKMQYIDAFNKMEGMIHTEKMVWQDQRTASKIGRKAETEALARFVDYAMAQGSTSARLYYMNVTKMTHQALNLIKQGASQSLRDSIDSMGLAFLTTAEYLVQQTIEEGMAMGLPYKDIYKLAKHRVATYAATLPIQRHITDKGVSECPLSP